MIADHRHEHHCRAVNENAANGTAVGVTANSFDSDATANAITYGLDDNAGGRFTINSVTGIVTVANDSLLTMKLRRRTVSPCERRV